MIPDAIGAPAIGSKGLTLLCPNCKLILTDFEAISRWQKTLNGGKFWLECSNCDYRYPDRDGCAEGLEKPLEYRMPVKHLGDAKRTTTEGDTTD